MATITKTVTLIPSGYTGLTGMTISSAYTIDSGYTDADSTTYCRLDLGASTTGYVYYTFDTSEIPAGATIVSVTARGKARVYNTTSVTNTVMQFYANTTAKGSNTAFESTTATVRTLSPGSWTRSELSNLRLRVGGTAASISSSSTRRIAFYGADITITYETASAPVITVGTPTRTIISDESGYDQCVCTFTSDQNLQQWEARATKAGVTPARGVGLLVESSTTLAAGATGTVIVDNEELTQGDGEYTITVYGQSTGGIWSE